jgi:hypothetical protein
MAPTRLTLTSRPKSAGRGSTRARESAMAAVRATDKIEFYLEIEGADPPQPWGMASTFVRRPRAARAT